MRCECVSIPSSRSGSLATVFDHVGVAVSDLAFSTDFYRRLLSVLGREPSYTDELMVGWEDWWIGASDAEHPLTCGLHVGLRASSRAMVDAFWRAGIEAGLRDTGAPGSRPAYTEDYYGAFLLDPDGNSVEAVHRTRDRAVPDGCIDHLWLRVRDPRASLRFYATVAPYAGLSVTHESAEHVQLWAPDFSFSLVRDGRPPSAHVHLAFSAASDASVREFHAAALAAGYSDNGAPGERPVYHAGYYGAFVLDPDGHNVELVNHNR